MKLDTQDAVFNLEYNAERSHLIIPEYGRHLQKLIDLATAIEDKEERNKAAKYIIDVMECVCGRLNISARIVVTTNTDKIPFTKFLFGRKKSRIGQNK